MRISSFALLCLLAMLAWARPTHAAESYDNCTAFITSIPAVISTQGTWCLKQDLATAITSGAAITINTNNVTIDCNDFKLGGQSAGPGTNAAGIQATNRLNATVRHCNIRGFSFGVIFNGSSGGGHVVEDSRFDGNTFDAINVEGDGSVVRRNRIFDTGGTTNTANAYGIYTYGTVDVLDNTISNVVARSGGNGSCYGIWLDASGGAPIYSSISGNRIRGLVAGGASGAARGIWQSVAGRINVRGNDLDGDAAPASLGVLCGGAGNAYKDNMISGFAAGQLACTDGGGNVISL